MYKTKSVLGAIVLAVALLAQTAYANPNINDYHPVIVTPQDGRTINSPNIFANWFRAGNANGYIISIQFQDADGWHELYGAQLTDEDANCDNLNKPLCSFTIPTLDIDHEGEIIMLIEFLYDNTFPPVPTGETRRDTIMLYL